MRRPVLVVIGLVAVAMAAVAGWVGATLVQAPADDNANGFEPSTVTATVERQVLSSTVVARGTVGYGQPVEVALPGAQGIVTVPAVEGALLEEGEAAVEVSGRQVFVMQGDVPMYRELSMGVEGDDVAQLQAGLDRLGYDVGGDDSGVFGSATSSAVEDWYSDAGVARNDAVVPKAGLVFLPSLPVRVDAVMAGRAAPASGPLFAVTGSALSVASSLDRGDRRLVQEGDAATVALDELGIEVEATVSTLADEAGTSGLDEQRFFMGVDLPADAPTELVDASVRITIPVESTDGEVLTVPVGALSTSADGTVRVEVVPPDGAETSTVRVATGLVAQGSVEVTPVEGSLSEGQEVVVGIGGARSDVVTDVDPSDNASDGDGS